MQSVAANLFAEFSYPVSFPVGLGGTVAFFLGFSFLTGIEMFYFIIEYFLELAIILINSCVIKVDRISVVEQRKMSTRASY